MNEARVAYDRGRGDYARTHDHKYFNEDAHNAGLEAVYRVAYENGKKEKANG